MKFRGWTPAYDRYISINQHGDAWNPGNQLSSPYQKGLVLLTLRTVTVTRLWLKKFAIVAVAIGVIKAGSPATPASASSCYTPWCGGVMTNNGSGYFWVTNCWGSGTEWYGNFPPCATGGWNAYAANSYFWLAPTDTTANYYWYYDTGAFRIDAGCRMTAASKKRFRSTQSAALPPALAGRANGAGCAVDGEG